MMTHLSRDFPMIPQDFRNCSVAGIYQKILKSQVCAIVETSKTWRFLPG